MSEESVFREPFISDVDGTVIASSEDRDGSPFATPHDFSVARYYGWSHSCTLESAIEAIRIAILRLEENYRLSGRVEEHFMNDAYELRCTVNRLTAKR